MENVVLNYLNNLARANSVSNAIGGFSSSSDMTRL